MALDPTHARQIAQFIFIAEHYLDLAHERASVETTQTLGGTKGGFMPGIPLDAETRRLAIISAHISSAAIRLASVEDVLEDAEVPDAEYRACRRYFNGNGPDNPKGRTCSGWFHVMLRDNAAHEEPPRAPSDTKERRRRHRQDCIERTTFADAYRAIRAIADEVRVRVTTTHGIALPF